MRNFDVQEARRVLKMPESPYALDGEPKTREDARKVLRSIDEHCKQARHKGAGTESLEKTARRLRDKWNLLP